MSQGNSEKCDILILNFISYINSDNEVKFVAVIFFENALGLIFGAK